MISGAFLPRISLSGPATSCPSARPSKNAVKLNWANDAGDPKLSESLGSAGKYMSTESGPNADRDPRIKANCSLFPRVRTMAEPVSLVEIDILTDTSFLLQHIDAWVICCWQSILIAKQLSYHRLFFWILPTIFTRTGACAK